MPVGPIGVRLKFPVNRTCAVLKCVFPKNVDFCVLNRIVLILVCVVLIFSARSEYCHNAAGAGMKMPNVTVWAPVCGFRKVEAVYPMKAISATLLRTYCG